MGNPSLRLSEVLSKSFIDRYNSYRRDRKRYFQKYSEAVHILHRMCITSCSEFTVHMHNQLKAGSFVRTKAGLSHDVIFSLMHVL